MTRIVINRAYRPSLGLLRIVASVVCLLTSLAFAALWMRSYTTSDSSWTHAPYASFMSIRGIIVLNYSGLPIHFSELMARWKGGPIEIKEPIWWEEESVWGFDCRELLPGRIWVQFPHWAPALLLALTGTGLALRWPRRVSVRGALIMTTIVAILLGLAVGAK
jgi:hypothetical protein